MITKQEKKISAPASPVPATSPYIDEEYLGDLDSLVSQVNEKLNSWRIGRVIWDPTYYESMAMYVGRQNVWYNPTSKSLEPIYTTNSLQSQEVMNVIIGKVVTEISRFTSFGPTGQVLPQTGSTRDALAARAAKLLIQNNYYNPDLNYQQEYARMAMYDIVQGHAFLKTYWDPTGGRAFQEYETEPDMMEIMFEAKEEGETFPQELDEFLNNPEKEADGEDEEKDEKDDAEDQAVKNAEGANISDLNPQKPKGMSVQVPRLDEFGKPKMRTKTDEKGNPQLKEFGYEGCVRKKARSPLNIYYSPAVANFGDLFDLVDVDYLSVDEIRTTIPNCEDINPDDKETNNLNPWQMIYGLTIDRNPQGQTSGLLVKEYWAKACPAFPKGLRLVIVKDKIRIGGPMDTLEGERLPYSHTFYHDIGTMRGLGMVEKERTKQRVLNKLYTQYVGNAELFENPHILMNAKTKFTEEPTNKGATAWMWTGTQEPKPWNPNALSPAHMELIRFTSDMIDQTSHVSKLAEGQVQPNITSAEMMQTALEANYQANNMEVNRFQLMVADSDYLALRFIQDRQDKEILIRFIGQDGRLVTDCFDNAVLKGNFSISVQPGQIGNNSRAQQASDLKTFMPLLLQGQVDDPDTKRIYVQKVMDYLSFGEETRAISELNKQQNYARSWINEIKNSFNIPDIQVQWLLQPFIDFKVWKEEIENVLLDKDEFESWHQTSRDRLMQLWHLVTNQLTKMQQQAAQSIQTGLPQPGKGGPGPAPLPGGPMVRPPMLHPAAPHIPHGGKIAGQGIPKPSIISSRVPQMKPPVGTEGVSTNGANV